MSCIDFYINRKLLLALLVSILVQNSYGDGKPFDVETRSLGEIAKKVERSASSLVVSEYDATIKAELSAVIDQIAVKVGDRVEVGELLVGLDCTDYRLAVELADADLQASEANLSFAQLQYQRALDLKAKSLNSVLDVDTRKTELASSRASKLRSKVIRKQAQRDVARCKITAPFSGVVVEKLASKGELVSLGTALLHFVGTDAIELSANVDPLMAAELTESAEYQFITQQSGQKAHFNVSLARVVDVIDSTQRSVEARFQFVGKKPPVGASGKLRWESGSYFLPQRYLSRQNDRDGVFVLDEGEIQFKDVGEVQVGLAVEVDFPANTQVVVSGSKGLKTE